MGVKTNVTLIPAKLENIFVETAVGAGGSLVTTTTKTVTDHGVATAMFEYVNSVDSGLIEKKWLRVSWKPRNWALQPPRPYMKKPLMQVPVLKPRRLTQSDKSWNKARRNFDKLHRYVALVNLKREDYNWRAGVKYRKRLENYNRLLKLRDEGLLRLRRPVRACSILNRNDNPYVRLRKTDYGIAELDVTRNCDQRAYRAWWGSWYQENIPFSFLQGNGSITQGIVQGTSNWLGLLDGTEGFDQTDKDATERKALNRLFDRIKRQEFSVGEMTAERHQTWTTFRDILKKIRVVLGFGRKELVALAQKGRGRETGLTKMVAKEVSNDFLMWTYGIKPLMQDIQAIVARLSSESDPLVIVVRSSATGQKTTQCGEVEIIDHYNVRYTVRFSVINPLLANLNQIGVVSPLEIGWEVFKFSFVIDWFYNLGQYIDQLGAFTGIEFDSGTRSETWRRFRTYRHRTHTEDGGGVWTKDVEKVMSDSEERKERTVLTTAPTPLLPEFKNPVSLYHIEVLLALIIQRLK